MGELAIYFLKKSMINGMMVDRVALHRSSLLLYESFKEIGRYTYG
jgi:hypothetical protein